MYIYFQPHLDCARCHSSDYRTDRLVHIITVVLHVVQIRITICMYYSVVHHVRILEKNFVGHQHSYYDII
jgi:hypothetical protein